MSYRWKVLCLDAASGKTLWEKTARDGRPTIPTHRNNTYASETPATDGERVVAYFGMTGVYCYDFAGNLLWTRDLGTHPTMFGWGTGSSPILFGDKVYIQCDNDEASFLVALDKKTGKDVWRVDRDEQTNWSTPYIWKNKNRTELVTAGGSKFRSYDPESGKLLWSMTGSGRTATTPVGNADLLYVDSYDRFSGGIGVFAAIRPGASGDISLGFSDTSNSHVAWSTLIKGFRVASPVICQGLRVYLGRIRWSHPLPRCENGQGAVFLRGPPLFKGKIFSSRVKGAGRFFFRVVRILGVGQKYFKGEILLAFTPVSGE